jgi:hypothetical protein
LERWAGARDAGWGASEEAVARRLPNPGSRVSQGLRQISVPEITQGQARTCVTAVTDDRLALGEAPVRSRNLSRSREAAGAAGSASVVLEFRRRPRCSPSPFRSLALGPQRPLDYSTSPRTRRDRAPSRAFARSPTDTRCTPHGVGVPIGNPRGGERAQSSRRSGITFRGISLPSPRAKRALRFSAASSLASGKR